MVDLRSDTVTQPTQSMRDAMMAAPLGDDVMGDDPTVIALQEKIAAMLGKEAALFVPSGTMSNAVAIKTHTSPGDELVCSDSAHIYRYEGGGFAALSGCSVALVDTSASHGVMDPAAVKKAIRKSEGSKGHFADGSLVCVETTSNFGGGTCYPQETLDAIAKVAPDDKRSSHTVPPPCPCTYHSVYVSQLTVRAWCRSPTTRAARRMSMAHVSSTRSSPRASTRRAW